MLLMRYDIALNDAAQLDTVRGRAKERGPLFDGMAGLDWKLFLADPVELTYATLYAWNDPAAATRFLDGPFFEALVTTFGRPEVRLLVPRLVTSPPSAIRHITRGESGADLRALDPLDGASFNVHWGEAQGRRFEVMYLARGSASTLVQ
ncbi:DUF4865 family protein [Roseiterribacter gracilis]|uniref:Uncharacterized protein n=1 Tax=Roseiterribacter gracilis TaxID=2812848 RepID=A0A8S8XBA5_9PROT|nr:hypothetical protein TMPK1_07770 [Rhodospirillales bacterium TMPK1]